MIETERLLLRQPRLADVPALFTFLGDPKAMQFTHVDGTLKECRQRVAVHEWRRRKDGYAPWTVEMKKTGRIIGWGGLYDDPFDPGWGVEIGYYFHPDAWGMGFGSELTKAVLREADEVLKLPKVAAFARPENAASRRLLEKAGFVEIRYVPEMQRFYFERLRT
ncbi:GNAT family N-acetyltransferase [Rhizobium terrae]|uniref:GNAT family N-acetyltransferase n=1 Tax=Rhizobium terrae TaxID=2171756 RepID=UPI000E3D82B2|nr:GNAT family N-acetyltransferase [Rhizobium terrae]